MIGVNSVKCVAVVVNSVKFVYVVHSLFTTRVTGCVCGGDPRHDVSAAVRVDTYPHGLGSQLCQGSGGLRNKDFDGRGALCWCVLLLLLLKARFRRKRSVGWCVVS